MNNDNIYKYCHEDRIDILKNGLIRFTQPSALNDSFEFSPTFNRFTNDEEILKIANDQLAQANKDKLKKNINVILRKILKEDGIEINEVEKNLKQDGLSLDLCVDYYANLYLQESKTIFTGDLNQLKHVDKAFINFVFAEKLREDFGVLCLTENPNNLLMWSHYANAHQGFVIEFDKNHDFFNKKPEFQGIIKKLQKVKYSKKRPEMMFYDKTLSKEQTKQTFETKFFLLKSDHWHYEEEWRMIDLLENSNKKIGANLYLFSLPFDCITGIIFGCKMKKEKKQEFVDLLKSDSKYHHIELKQAKKDYQEFKLVLEDIN